MEYTTYASACATLDADDVDDTVVEYDGLAVRGLGEDRVGTVDGFIVDAQAGRVYYIVVDSGGWFRSRRFLLPIGHATIDADRKALEVDISRAALSNYPEFDEDRFRQFSDEDLRTFEIRVAAACCPDETRVDLAAQASPYETSRHYAQPPWWKGGAYSQERLRPVDVRPAKSASVSDRRHRDAVGGPGGVHARRGRSRD